MKFYILGANGFMGSHCARYLQNQNHEVITDRVEITDLVALRQKFSAHKPEVVINFAGVRAYPTIDWCEDHKEETLAVNVGGSINAMIAALGVEAYPMQIASGCIYSGGPDQPFTEEDEPNFLGSFYSRMRVVQQNALKELPLLYLRLRMPISMYMHPRNLITKIVSYPKVISIPNSATLLEDMAPALEKLAMVRPTGILNLTNDGYITHEQILTAYKTYVDPNHSYTPITLDELVGQGGITKAKRSNCVLSTAKLKSFGIQMPALDDARIKEIMINYKSSIK